ncbi:DUF6083 domain-containing protein [Streptomyces scopuliridis]
MRLHPSSASKQLRKGSVTRCLYCHHLVEWYGRFDGGRIPLIPKEFPSGAVPERCRWSVSGGVAYIGAGGRGTCRIAHPTMCPDVDHGDNDPDLEGARRAHAVRTQKWINEGVFVPMVRADHERDVIDQQVLTQADDTRHVMSYLYMLWIAPTTIDKLRCVALAHSSGARCKNLVLESELYEGHWGQVDIPVPPGRAGRETLWSGQQMWVYNLNSLDADGYKRWISQRCHSHGAGSPAPDATPPEWRRFDTWKHSMYILHEAPSWPMDQRLGHPLLSLLQPLQKPTPCADTTCRNSSIATVEEGWLCWRCKPVHERRTRTHRIWQQSTDED